MGGAAKFTVRRAVRLLAGLVLLVGCVIVLAACGGSDDSGAAELARQQELAEARKEAAQDARQSAHIKQLERKLKGVQKQTASEPEATTTVAAPPQGSASAGDWPGDSGYTAILASLTSEPEARATQAEAAGRGLDAGVLYSSDFSSLRPGYWVVFSGSFATDDDAAARAAGARELGYADAYPRFVSP